MKTFGLIAATLVLGLAMGVNDAEAGKRLGGGSSMGMQRQAVSPAKNTQNATPAQQPAAPHQAAAPANAAQPAAQPRSSWMGPLAGLAAGFGLAALASHFGFGQELANIMMIGLLVVAAIALWGFISRRKSVSAQPSMQYAGAAAGAGSVPNQVNSNFEAAQPVSGSSASAQGHVPASFDVQGFIKQAKVNYIRLQAAYDAANFDDIGEFSTPEMFAELRLQRGTTPDNEPSDVMSLEANVVDVAEEASRFVVTVHFSGQIRESVQSEMQPINEMWHLVKPKDGSTGWLLAGIQQLS